MRIMFKDDKIRLADRAKGRGITLQRDSGCDWKQYEPDDMFYLTFDEWDALVKLVERVKRVEG